MILHCVFLRFRAGVTTAGKAAIYAEVAALKPRIPGMLDVASGKNVSPEGLHRGFVDGFLVSFTDASARDRYLADEEHAKVGAKIVAAAEGEIDGVFVYDLER